MSTVVPARATLTTPAISPQAAHRKLAAAACPIRCPNRVIPVAVASPASALGSPIKTFTAVFKLDKTSPQLMPDLSAAVVVEDEKGVEGSQVGGGK